MRRALGCAVIALAAVGCSSSTSKSGRGDHQRVTLVVALTLTNGPGGPNALPPMAFGGKVMAVDVATRRRYAPTHTEMGSAQFTLISGEYRIAYDPSACSPAVNGITVRVDASTSQWARLDCTNP